MNDYVTNSILKKELSAQTDELTDLVKTFMVQVDSRFNIVEARLGGLEEWIEQLAKKTNTKLTV